MLVKGDDRRKQQKPSAGMETAYAHNMTGRRQRQGFTLLEILVVVIILAALMAILLPTLLNQRQKASDTQIKSNVTNTYKALRAEYATDEVYTTAVISSAITNNPELKVTMATGGSALTYPTNNIEVSLVNSQQVFINSKSSNGKQFLLASRPSADGVAAQYTQANKLLPFSPITNIVTNPSFETDTASWTKVLGGDTAPTRVADSRKQGAWALEAYLGTLNQSGVSYAFPAGLTDGDTYMLVAWVTGISGDLTNFGVRVGDGAGTRVFSSPALTVGTPTRVALSWTVGSGGFGSVAFWRNGATAGTGIIHIDNVAIYRVATPLAVADIATTKFMDGDSLGAWWNGVPHASTSSGYVNYPSW